MLDFSVHLPLSLYVHLPWCAKKCPYCDFNSHALKQTLPEAAYLAALQRDLRQQLPLIQDRPIHSIFIGGGTPSLFSGEAITTLLKNLREQLSFVPDIEITLEANPGSVEQSRFIAYREAGVNRLSIGIQSFQADKLLTLGRIHNPDEAYQAALTAKAAGFTNFNIDLMFGLPSQTIDDALYDLTTALSLQPKHLSWYQLTLEPNTLFYHQPPALPQDELIWEMQQQGQQLLADNHFQHYEISAYALPGFPARHNLNYWLFGDYLGIGAGAHSKITDSNRGEIWRWSTLKHPQAYMTANDFLAEKKSLAAGELPLEFMLNALRLSQKIPLALFEQRTGLKQAVLSAQLQKAQSLKLLDVENDFITVTPQGKNFLNDLLQIFS